jgi:transcription elongation factor Elf1
MKDELLNCPFCGGEAGIKQTGKKQMEVKCKSCRMGMVNRVLKFDLEWLRTKLIEAWNKRIN